MKLENVITALVTPFNAENHIDYAALKKLLDWQIESGVSGIVVAGTTGESPTLSLAEKRDLFRFTVEHIDGRIPVIAGTGSNCTQASIELTQLAAESGIDAALVVVPYYNKPSQRGMIAHFTEIADQGGLPVILYNVPGRTIADLAYETVLTLAKHDNIIAIKEATTAKRMVALRAALPNDFTVLSGEDSETCRAMCDPNAPIDGIIWVTSNVAPQMMQELCELAKTNSEAAYAIDAKLAALHRDLFCDANPAPAKYALQQLGHIENILRLPLLPITDAKQTLVSAAMHDCE